MTRYELGCKRESGLKDSIVLRNEKGILRWFAHSERINNSRYYTYEIYKGEHGCPRPT